MLPHIDVAWSCGHLIRRFRRLLDIAVAMNRDTAHLLVVLNKTDQASAAQRHEVAAFTGGMIERRLGRPIERIFEVSARERFEEKRPTRDGGPRTHTYLSPSSVIRKRRSERKES